MKESDFCEFCGLFVSLPFHCSAEEQEWEENLSREGELVLAASRSLRVLSWERMCNMEVKFSQAFGISVMPVALLPNNQTKSLKVTAIRTLSEIYFDALSGRP